MSLSQSELVSAISTSLPGIKSKHLLTEAVYRLNITNFDKDDIELKMKILGCINEIIIDRMLNYNELLIFGYSRQVTNDTIPIDIIKHLCKLYGTEFDLDSDSDEYYESIL